ncbi:hypothetical protein HCJ02_01860 [Listeria seeligeri]|uniref:Phage protein n=1 Tax=Listeria immobilis TaxID=2713502 RepID=A0ABR6SV10_9LIST|nr:MULTISPECIES: hypothetical protein [Listeria]MBC1509462.1 hypothetical protein [Listeria immobilis]MBC1532079.1 hypothetical protein [Listeria seeligeri]MBC1840100.1 hypothetical protein [Listeria seeligeri]MBC6302481.1 hypothetical protein [Listeria immobilis]
MTEYAMYKGDDLLLIGTLTELAEFKNVTRDTILFYMSNAHKKRVGENGLCVIKIEDDEDEE